MGLFLYLLFLWYMGLGYKDAAYFIGEPGYETVMYLLIIWDYYESIGACYASDWRIGIIRKLVILLVN